MNNPLCQHNDICNNNQMIGAYIRQPLAVIILIFSLYRIVILYKNKIANNIIIIHLCVLIWAVIFLTGDILKMIQYLKIRDIQQFQLYPDWAINLMPRFWGYIDVSTGAIITTLLFLCPYYWIKNILYFLQAMSSNQDTHSFTRKLVKFAIIMAVGLISVFFINNPYYDNVIRYSIVYLGAQSILNILFVLYGRKFLISNFEELAMTDEDKTNNMKIQTNFMIFLSCMRGVNNIVVQFIAIWVPKINKRSFDEDLCIQQPDTYQYAIRYTIIILCTHYLAVGIILYLYKPQRKQNSLLNQKQNSQNNSDSFVF